MAAMVLQWCAENPACSSNSRPRQVKRFFNKSPMAAASTGKYSIV
jgi:hypothetical protein